MNIGSKVLIGGEHPHSGKVGKIEGVYSFKHGMGDAVKIEFADGDGCFVFRKDAGKVTLREVAEAVRDGHGAESFPAGLDVGDSPMPVNDLAMASELAVNEAADNLGVWAWKRRALAAEASLRSAKAEALREAAEQIRFEYWSDLGSNALNIEGVDAATISVVISWLKRRAAIESGPTAATTSVPSAPTAKEE